MTAATLHDLADGRRLRLEGEVGFASAASLWEQVNPYLTGSGAVSIDLGTVTRTDSAGVALLVHWTRQQRRLGGTVEFVNIPSQMRAIARVSGVDAILPLAES